MKKDRCPQFQRRIRRIARLGLVLGVAMAAACSWHEPYTVAVSVEPMMARCRNLGSVMALTDMGSLQINPKFRYGAQDAVLRTAEMMAATHVVWVSDHHFAAVLDAYHCQD
ncbi:MAG: hypothetical protein MUF46_05950 [Desulfobacterales bacterium]|nr:hypothetical protein [Desulfobacterales bacterium]MCU0584766.1 hypothetical protein [Desulfobacterales bacterium]